MLGLDVVGLCSGICIVGAQIVLVSGFSWLVLICCFCCFGLLRGFGDYLDSSFGMGSFAFGGV